MLRHLNPSTIRMALVLLELKVHVHFQVNLAVPQNMPMLHESPSGGQAGTSSGPGSLPTRPVATKMNPAMAGVSGILRREQEQQEEVDKNLKEAFQDLNGLMVCPLHS